MWNWAPWPGSLAQWMRPRSSLEEFRNQQPISLSGRVMWLRKDGEHTLYGIQFENLNEASRQALRQAVTYFNKAPEYQ